MENKEYLSEEQYQKSNAKVKKTGRVLLLVGVVILLIGLIMIVLGFFGFGNTAVNGTKDFESNMASVTPIAKGIFGSFGLFAIGGFINVLGLGLIGIGGICTFISYRREIKGYVIQQGMPIAKEGIEKLTPTVSNALGSISKEIAKGISSGIKEGKEDSENKN